MKTPPTITRSKRYLLRYQQIRQWSLQLCAPLNPEDYVVQPTGDVSPPKWHLGHTTWFFENFILREHLANYELFDERLNWFFNSYYESQGPRILRTNRGNMTRPSTATILAYREYVDEHLIQLLDQHQTTELPTELAQLLEIGLQHEQQHQELLVTDIKYILGTNPLYPAYDQAEKKFDHQSFSKEWLPMEAGLYQIGYQGYDFCWDNELSRHQVYLNRFALSKRLVTNREYLTFMEDGAYERFELWQMEGIEWARQLDIKAPLYWYEKEGTWYHYTLQGLSPIDLDAPVTHVSFFEADAYARWAGHRLPTEQEWEVVCQQQHQEIPAEGNFVENQNWRPIAPIDDADDQLLGNVWEWTNSAYLPYPRYPRPEGALGEYNGKFMINQMVLRGGSCATPRSHIRATYRNFFQTDKRWQFTGIRLAKDLD
ncbi:ergothioneine biosynthesis protein EgtB [Lewinella sp. LCG006]|uniref:ergothioneine biosynthesis protein EgtB n=1 Tax=Lewinella sp. LCG006 TaxID=3231911 RepID=UPI003460AF58